MEGKTAKAGGSQPLNHLGREFQPGAMALGRNSYLRLMGKERRSARNWTVDRYQPASSNPLRPPEALRNLERRSCKTVFLGSHDFSFERLTPRFARWWMSTRISRPRSRGPGAGTGFMRLRGGSRVESDGLNQPDCMSRRRAVEDQEIQTEEESGCGVRCNVPWYRFGLRT